MLADYTPMAYPLDMLTIIESPLFTRMWPDYWSEEERADFASYVAASPDAGDVVPGSGGCRKIRWGSAGIGKRGGVRVIYTTRLTSGAVVLLIMYAKSAQETIPSHVLRQIAEEFGYATH
jgi:hypothetical protein